MSQKFYKQQRMNFGKRQINGIHQHLAGLHPFFEGMRAALKALTQHVNPSGRLKRPRPQSRCSTAKAAIVVESNACVVELAVVRLGRKSDLA